MVGDMSKRFIKKNVYERCLLTEASPYETPLIWSNWGSFNYERTLKYENIPKHLKYIFDDFKPTIPYNYYYNKDINKRRLLTIIHPNASSPLTEIYEKYSLYIVRLCQKSSFSIRKPHSIAKYFNYRKTNNNSNNYIEQLDENQAYASSFFSYTHFSLLHKFYESSAYKNLEKQYQYLSHADILKCFPSIYSHTIDWAIRRKEYSKNIALTKGKNANSFGIVFDKFMQKINYNETNGIIIGPEFSRIFAEIILQDIDQAIEKSLEEINYKFKRDYFCTRYIDDYFIFYNDSNVYNCFLKALSNELEKYKLYINISKINTLSRPFITSISIKKIKISEYIQSFIESIINNTKVLKIKDINREINKVRSLLKDNHEENYAVTNFFISALNNKINKIKSTLDDLIIYSAFNQIIDITFYLVNSDIRVSSIFRIGKLLLLIISSLKDIDKFYKNQILDKIYTELLGLIENSCNLDLIIETMNILIVATEIDSEYDIPLNNIESIYDMSLQYYCPVIGKKRITYFEIISILFYIQDKPIYKSIHDKIIEDVKCILKYYNPKTSSESAHLLLDIVSCPFIIKQIKKELVEISLSHIDVSLRPENIGRFINYVEKHSWYTNWSSKNDLSILLKKKEFLSPYS